MNIIVAGGTGQVGLEVLQLLANTEHSVFALVRRENALGVKAKNITEVIFDYKSDQDYSIKFNQCSPDQVICALGTTMKKAGSVEAFNEVDRDYPIKLIHALKEKNPAGTFVLVSSVGADHPTGVYLKAKHEVELALEKSGLKFIIARPSFLLSNREEFRLGEVVVEGVLSKPYLFLARRFAPQSTVVWKYAPIPVAQVAKALVMPIHQSKVIEGLQFYEELNTL